MSERRRGQLIVVGGLGLAVALVLLALVLNSAIYTENLASRQLDSGGDAIETSNEVAEGLGGLMNGVNDPATASDYSTLETEYTDGVGEWSAVASQYGALHARGITVATATTGGNPVIERGVRVVDEDESTKLTPRGNTPADWTVAPGVRAREFGFVVTSVDPDGDDAAPSDSDVETELSSGSWTEGPFFYVDIDDGEWRMAVYDDGSGDVKVGVYDSATGTYSVCSNTPAATPVRIDVGRGTVNNVPCEPLASIAKQTGPYTVHFSNSEELTGSYELTADRVMDDSTLSGVAGPFTDVVDAANYDYHCGDSGNPKSTYYSPSDGIGSGNYPYVAPALFSSAAELDARTDDVESATSVRIASEELSAGASSPRVSRFDVTDQSGSGDAKFSISWEVADPDGNLDLVEVELISGGGTEASASDDAIDGQRTASGTFTLQDAVTLPATYDVKITVTDSSGNTRTVTQRHEAEDPGDDSGCPE